MYKINTFEVLKELKMSDEARGLRARTVTRNQSFNNKFLVYVKNNFNVATIDEIRPIHVKSFLASVKARGNKASYVNVYRKCVKAYFRYAESEEYIEYYKNPMLRVPSMKEDQVLVFPFSDADIRKMITFQKKK